MWGVEVANGIIVGQRKKRLRQPEIQKFAALFQNLSIEYDTRPVRNYIQTLLPLAHAHGLCGYDSAYLELALRHDIPVATLDRKLQNRLQTG